MWHGFLGVDFFFVLSGFLIMSSHFDDEKKIASFKLYVSKRFVRIFPPYWPISITLIISYLLLPNLSQGSRAEFSWLSSLFLLPDSSPAALVVAWTLIHEMMFYMIFCLYFISNRLFLTFVGAWLFAIGISAWFALNTDLSPFLDRLLQPINIEFVLGMGVAYLARGVSDKHGKFYVMLGLSGFVLLLFLPRADDFRVLFGLPFSALVLGFVLLERQGGMAFPRWMVLLGDASYSIYLIHNPLVSITSRLVSRFNSFASWGAGMLIGVLSSIIAGVLYHLLIEKPLIRLFRTFFMRQKIH